MLFALFVCIEQNIRTNGQHLNWDFIIALTIFFSESFEKFVKRARAQFSCEAFLHNFYTTFEITFIAKNSS